MNQQTRRYVFIDFENLKRIKFKKLEKVCDKIFVFIHDEETFVPFKMVQQMQKMGNNVKWLAVDVTKDNDLNFHISFLMGKLHQKVSSDIEFAILSNNEAFDPLVNYINLEGRSCVRVKRKRSKGEYNGNIQQDIEVMDVDQEQEEEAWDEEVETMVDLDILPNGNHAVALETPVLPRYQRKVIEDEIDEEIVEKTAEETIRRLIRSGNRPAEIEMLKEYILLHNQEMKVHKYIDNIIVHMEATNDIDLKEQAVIYNF